METARDISRIFELPIVLIDTETTGMSSTQNSVIEIGAIRIENGEVVKTMNQLVQPRVGAIPRIITEITGITNADVADAPLFEDVSDDLLSMFEGDARFVAHNASFDYSFLNHAYALQDTLFEPEQFCTVKLSRALYGKERRHSLQTIIEHHNIEVHDRHRAYEDALVMWKFMQIAYQDKGVSAFQQAVTAQL